MNPSKYIKSYSLYLEEKAGSFRVAKYDWVKQKDEAIAKFRSMENDEQLLKDTEMLQKQTDAAIGCNWDLDSVSDIVLQQGFRYMISDSVTLFLLGNEAIVRILSTLCCYNVRPLLCNESARCNQSFGIIQKLCNTN